MFNKIIKNPDILLLLLIISLLIGYTFLAKDFIELSEKTYVHLTVFSILFSIWYRLIYSIANKINTRKFKPFIPLSLTYSVAILLFCYSIIQALLVLNMSDMEELMSFRSIVSGAGDSEESISLKVGISFPAVLMVSYLAQSNKNLMLKVIFSTMALILAILSTSKIFLLLWVLSLLMMSKVSVKKVVITVALFLLLFSLSHIALQKFSSNPDDGLLNALLDTLSVYYFGALAAYNKLITNTAYIEPTSMFVGLKSILEFFSISIEAEPVLPWTNIGRWYTNNYTAFGYWYAYFGTGYLIAMPIFLGIYYGLFFSTTIFFRVNFEFYRIFLLLCLIFVIFGDQFFPALYMHLSFIFFSLFASLTKGKKIKR